MKVRNMDRIARLFGRAAATAMAFALVAIGVLAQDTTSTTVRRGTAQYDTTVKNAEVVYVEGNDLILRVDNGRIEHLVVPDTDRFTINGRDVSVHELTPGTKLTQTITTTTVPHYVTTVRTLKGRVFHVNPPRSVIVTLPEGGNQRFTVPNDAKFTINGEKKTVFDLRKGNIIEATIVTDETQDVVQMSKSTTGQVPTPPTPVEVGVLLFMRLPSAPPSTTAGQPASPNGEQIASKLPKTGSLLPLVGLLGALAIAMSFGLGVVRKRQWRI